MNTISITYNLKWQISFAPHYQVSECGKVFNCKTNRLSKRCYNGGSIGYWIKSKFYTLESLRSKLELIPKKGYVPF